MKASEAAALIDAGGSASLRIQDKSSITIQNLEVIGEAPSSRDKFRTVLVADLRWKWSRKLITGRYNCRRRTGQKYLVAESGILQLGQSFDQFQFQPATLKDETKKWTPKEMMEDVLKKLADGDEFDFEFDVEGDTDQLEVNDVEIRENGPDALTIALQHLPGTTLWVDKLGKVHVQSAIGLKEAQVIGRMGPDVVDRGHASKVSYKLTRPSKINVYFVREQEVRHDTATASGSRAALVDQRYMTNVCLVTDPVVSINGKDVCFGSWAAFDELFPYWNQTLPAAEDNIPVPPAISHDMIQKLFFEDALTRLYVPFGSDTPQPIWMGRINAVKTHYRQTWQLNRRWVDRSYSIQPIRCAILDPTTGIRGRAQVYGDYCVKVAALPMNLKAHNGRLWKNVYGGENDGKFSLGTQLKDAEVTPAIVSVVDDQAGIVHFDYVVDPYGAWKQIYPSVVDNLPSAVMNDNKPKGANMVIGSGGSFPKLTDSDAKAVVLTHVPSVPNGNGQFYKITVTPGDVSNLVKGLTIEPAQGPEWDVFVDVVTARFAWQDEFSSEIERSFGVGVVNQTAQQAANDAAVLQSLLINEDDLKAVANAKAAEIWSKLTDRYIGTKSVRMDPEVVIKGSIEAVAHTIDPDGVVLTTVSLPEELASRDFRALLPAGTRKLIFREVVPR